MTPQQLRNSILQMAIEGKLTEQRAEDGNASDLLKEIKAEKAKLIAEKKIKKEKSLPEISENEIPFEIPDNWVWVRLGDIVSKLTDGSHNPPANSGSGYKVISAMNIKKGKIVLDNVIRFTDEIGFEKENLRTQIKRGDIIIGIIGGSIGNLAYYNHDEKVIAQRSIAIIDSLIDNYYVGNTLLSPFIQGIMKKSSGTAQGGIYLGTLKSLLVPMPPLSEQKRIVVRLEEILLLVDEYEKAYNELQELNKKFPDNLKNSLLQMAIEGKLVEQRAEDGNARDLLKEIQAEKAKLIAEKKIKKEKPLPEINEDETPFEIPDNWIWCYINYIAFVTKLAGFEYTKNIFPNLQVDGIPLFKGKNVQNGHLVYDFDGYIPEEISDSLPRSQIVNRCLLTPYVGTIGNIAIFNGEFKAHLGSNVGKIEIFNRTKLHIMEEYVLYYLRCKTGYKELTKYKKATAQESISIEAIRNVIIPIPPLAEQKRIVAKLEQILPLCDELSKEYK